MLTLIQNKVVLGNTVAFDSPSTEGHGIFIIVSYENFSQYPLNLSDLTNMLMENSLVNWNYTPDFTDGYGLAIFHGVVTSTGIVSFNYTIESGTISNLITCIIETSVNTYFFYDITQDYDEVGSITFNPSSVTENQICFYCLSSNLDDNIFTFPVGTQLMFQSGSGALGVAYIIPDSTHKTISGEASTIQVLREAFRFTDVADPLSIGCGVLTPRGIAD